MESTQKIITEDPDSLEMGSSAKGIKVKIYGNFKNLEAFKAKIDNARAMKDYANKILTPQI